MGVVYYELLNVEVQTNPMYEFRCDERQKDYVVYSESLKRNLKTNFMVPALLFIMNR